MFRLGLVMALLLGLTSTGLPQLIERKEAPVEIPAGMKDEDDEYIEENEYVFNPVQAKREFKVGRFYMKKGSPKAALGRFQEATKWNPMYAEAFYWAGIANTKLSQPREAVVAFEKYLALEPEGKQTAAATERIVELRRLIEELPVVAGDAPE